MKSSEKSSASVYKRKRGTRTEYIARLQYYDDLGVRREKTRSASGAKEAKRLLNKLEEEYQSGGTSLLDAHKMTFAYLAEHLKTERYCAAKYDAKGQKLLGVRNPQKHASTIKRLTEYFGHFSLAQIKVVHLSRYRRTRLETRTNRGRLTASYRL